MFTNLLKCGNLTFFFKESLEICFKKTDLKGETFRYSDYVCYMPGLCRESFKPFPFVIGHGKTKHQAFEKMKKELLSIYNLFKVSDSRDEVEYPDLYDLWKELNDAIKEVKVCNNSCNIDEQSE